jgi:hypothetical protein
VFFIVNKTKGTIIISDIGVTLGPRQAVDLDKMMGRSKSEASKMLKSASKKGHVDIRIKDGGKKPNIKPPEQVGGDLDDFKKEMLEEMKGLLSNQQQPTPQAGLGKEDLAAFAQQIISNIPKSETVIIQGQPKEVRTDEEVEMDEDLLAKINARTVDKIVEGTDINSINYKEEKQENTILDNISELEDLIG